MEHGMTLDEALKWADTFGPLQSDPPDGDARALMVLAAEVRRMRQAAEIGALWMRWWLDQHECDCDGEHTCGRRERENDLRSIEAALMGPNVEVSGGASAPSA